MRTSIAALLFAFISVAFASEEPSPWAPYVDLNGPGVMEMVRVSNPDHYAKIVTILDGLGRRQPGSVPRWIQTEFKAKAVSFPLNLRTSFPAQQYLSFTLGDTHYRSRVTLERNGAAIYSIRAR